MDQNDFLQRIIELSEQLLLVSQQLTAIVSEQKEFNRQQVAINERLETLVVGMLRQKDNGRDA